MPGSSRRHWLPGEPGGARLPRGNWVATLRRFVASPAIERCELCGNVLGAAHTHLVAPAGRRLLCVCENCVTAVAAASDSECRVVPADSRRLVDFRMTDAEWDALRLPIDMAFLFHSTPDGRPIALYPGPAGATESLLSLDAWGRLVESNPDLAEIEPDVEALLINRIDGARELMPRFDGAFTASSDHRPSCRRPYTWRQSRHSARPRRKQCPDRRGSPRAIPRGRTAPRARRCG
jgi:hypothetical protein